MANTTTTTPAQRQAALQQLRNTFGQTDGSMIFTYNGHVVQTVRVNSDGTLQLKDIQTGNIIGSADPVDVYTAARSVSGDPVPPPPAPKPASLTPSMLATIMKQIGTFSGLANQVSSFTTGFYFSQTGKELNSFFTNMLPHTDLAAPELTGLNAIRNSIGKFFAGVGGTVLGAVSAGLSVYSVFTGIQSLYQKGFSVMGTLSVLGSTLGLATGLNLMLHAASFTGPVGWVAAAGVLSAAITYGSINSMITNGVTAGNVALAAAGTLGIAFTAGFIATAMALAAAEGVAISSAMSSVLFTMALTNPIGWAIAGAVVLFAVLWSIFHQPSPEEAALTDLNKALTPVIWTAGPLLFIGASVAATLMGWPKTGAPIMSSLTMPKSFLTRTLGPSIPIGSAQSPTVLVQKGVGTDPTKVIIVTPNGSDARGNPILSLTSYNLSQNLSFVSSATPQTGYIPFFIYRNGNPIKNPDVVTALARQDSLLRSVATGALTTAEAINAINIASSLSKYGVDPTANN